MDMAIYSLITMILFEEEEQETKHDKSSWYEKCGWRR
jgi:hypothetical protein